MNGRFGPIHCMLNPPFFSVEKTCNGMKRILPYVLVLVLAIVVVVQYMKLQRLNPPEAFQYEFREDIDLDYHDPTAVGAYYETGRMAGTYARDVWRNGGVHVLTPGDALEDQAAAKHYNRLLSHADSLGARLARSLQFKNQGYNNADILRMENEGLSLKRMEILREFGGETLKRGDESDGVYVLQGLLIQMGYEMPHDGYFWQETEVAVREYQKKKGLPASGIAGLNTLLALLSNK